MLLLASITLLERIVMAVTPRSSMKDAVLQSLLAYNDGASNYRWGRRRRRSYCSYRGGDGQEMVAENRPTELEQVGAEGTKYVLILMSDTGGGHRASAEAIRHAFQIEFGDKYSVFVKDVWKEHAAWMALERHGEVV